MNNCCNQTLAQVEKIIDKIRNVNKFADQFDVGWTEFADRLKEEIKDLKEKGASKNQ